MLKYCNRFTCILVFVISGCNVNNASISWKTPGAEWVLKQYSETFPEDDTWCVAVKNEGNDWTKIWLSVYNEYDTGETATEAIEKDFYSLLTHHEAGAYYYEQDGDEIYRCVYEGIEQITIASGIYDAAKQTCRGAKYQAGRAPEEHDYLPTKEWTDWFHPDYLLLKEVDHWVDNEVSHPYPIITEFDHFHTDDTANSECQAPVVGLAGDWVGSYQLAETGFPETDAQVTFLEISEGEFSGLFSTETGAGGTITVIVQDENGNVAVEITEDVGPCSAEYSGYGNFDGHTLEISFGGNSSCYGTNVTGTASISPIVQ
jgi:hypothetical protein